MMDFDRRMGADFGLGFWNELDWRIALVYQSLEQFCDECLIVTAQLDLYLNSIEYCAEGSRGARCWSMYDMLSGSQLKDKVSVIEMTLQLPKP